MKFTIVLVIIMSLGFRDSFGQGHYEFSSPYKTSWVDGVISAGGIGLSYWGLKLMKNKKAVSKAEIERIDADLEAAKANIPAFDRWAVGNYNEQAEKWSDVPFYTSFGLPLLYLAHERTRANAPQIGFLYLETMAITGALFTQANGRINRIRPSVYNHGAGDEVRMDDKSKNAFYGGHTSATAAASFFTAKIFNDFFPDSPAKPYVWAGAITLPAVVASLRLKAGKHYLSDNIIGYAVGAGAGILVPHLHKRSSRLSLFPGQDLFGNRTINFEYRF